VVHPAVEELTLALDKAARRSSIPSVPRRGLPSPRLKAARNIAPAAVLVERASHAPVPKPVHIPGLAHHPVLAHNSVAHPDSFVEDHGWRLFIHRTGHNRVRLRPERPDGCWAEVRSAEAIAQPNGASMTVSPLRILGGSTFIPMVEPAELRDGDDFASGGWQYWTGLRTVLVK
jgi:hypothetical protein